MGSTSSDQHRFKANQNDSQNWSQIIPLECFTQELFSQQKQCYPESQENQEILSQKLIKEMDFEQLIQKFKIKYKETFQYELQSVKNYDIKTLEIIIQSLWPQIISQKLMNVNENKITINQCKVFIAESLLSILIQSMNYTNQKYTISHANVLFQRLNDFANKLCGFLKTQYSRGKDIDAGKLIKEFKEFDYTDKFKYDIIQKAGVLFKTNSKTFQYDPNDKIEEKYPFQSDSDRQEQQNKSVGQSITNDQQKQKELQGNNGKQNDSSDEVDEVIPSDQLQSDFDRQNAYIEEVKQNNVNNQNKQQQWESSDGNYQRAQFEITNNIKILLNRLMDQTDKNYSKFEEMIYEIDQRLEFKIGRKISQNTSRCTLLDTGVVEIDSIQVARVLVKWLENLKEIIQKPGQILTQDYELKAAKFHQYNSYLPVQQINHTQIHKIKKPQNQNIRKEQPHVDQSKKQDVPNSEENPKSLPKLYGRCKANEWKNFVQKKSLIKKLLEKSEDLKNKEKEDKKYFKQFSTSILHNLQNAKFEQREISRQKMEIVKYSYEVSSLISQIVESQLISTIQILTQLSEQNSLQNGVPNLIKFKVNDLMRCQISGNQDKINKIFNQIRKLDSEDKIQIVRIKNRFSTDNHDAMVFFRMKGSFLLCECQLALTDEKDKDDRKIKNIFELNHFFYELVRSPFGIFGQLAVFLKTESKTVSSFYKQLKLKLSSEKVDVIKTIYQTNKVKLDQQKQQKQKNKKKQQEEQKQQLQNESDQSQQEEWEQKLVLSQKKKRKQKLVLANNKRPYVCSICLKYYNRMSSISTLKFSHEPAAIKVCDDCFESKQFELREEQQKSDKNQQSQSQQVFKSLKKHLINMKNAEYFNEKKTEGVEEMFELIDEEQIENNINNKQKQTKENKDENQNTNDQKDKTSQGNGNSTQERPARKLKITKMKAEQLMKFLDNKESETISAGWKVFFVIFSTIGSHSKFVLYRYDWSQGVIENVYSPIQKYLKHEQLRFDSTSKMFLFRHMYKTDISEEKNQQETDDKKSNNQTTFNNCKDKDCSLYLFDYQRETMQKKQIDTSINEFYFIFKKLSGGREWYFYIDAEKYKGNGRNDCLVQELNKLPAIKNLKFKVDLSNLAANDQALQELKGLVPNQKDTKPQEVEKLVPNQDATENDGNNTQLQQHQNTTNSPSKQMKPQNTKQSPSYSWVKNIKVLDLSHNNLVKVGILSQICPNLKVLDLSNNKIQKFQTHKNHQKLTKLYLNGNNISSFEDEGNLKSVEILNLNINQINKIALTQVPTLKILNLSGNQIESLNCTKMPRLKILNLNDNKMQEIVFQSSSIIEQLYLDANQLTDQKLLTTRESEQNQTNQQESLKKQKDAFNFKLQHLRILSIKQNKLETLSILVGKLFELKNLKLAIQELRLDNNFFRYGFDENLPQNRGQASLLGILTQEINDQTKNITLQKSKYQENDLTLNQIRSQQGYEFHYVLSQNDLTNQQLPKQPDLQIFEHQIKLFEAQLIEHQIKFEHQIKQPQDRTVKNKNTKVQKEAKIIDKLLQDNVKFSLPVKSYYLCQNQDYFNFLFNFYKEWLKLKQQDKEKNKSQSQLIKARFPLTIKQQQSDDDKIKKYWKKKPMGRERVVELEKGEESKEEVFQSRNQFYLRCWCQYDDNRINQRYQKSYDSDYFYYLGHYGTRINMELFFKFDWQMLWALDLQHCQIDDDQWDKFTKQMGQKIPNLKRLHLNYNQIKTVTKQQLLQFSSSIQLIELKGNPLSDDSKIQIWLFKKEKRQNENKQIKIQLDIWDDKQRKCYQQQNQQQLRKYYKQKYQQQYQQKQQQQCQQQHEDNQ